MTTCQAIVEDFSNGKSFSGLLRPTTVPKIRGCTRRATWRVGALCLCAQHKALALDGFLSEDGEVTTRPDRQNYQRGRVPGRPNSWAKGLTPKVMT